MAKDITKRAVDYAQWYIDVVLKRRNGRLFAGQGLYGHQTQTATRCGRTCNAISTGCSRRRGTSTRISRCSFRKVS